jgi:hypothetical protein
MAISIDTVYQKVLTFANKEQRGYITPQEYNLFADQAQKEIFEQYFYDLNQYHKLHGENSEYVDVITNINEKLSIFETTATMNSTTLPSNLYRLGSVYSGNIIVEEVQRDEFNSMQSSPLTMPTQNRPIYVRKSSTTIETEPISAPTKCSYIKIPTSPYWGYVVVGGKAMYDPSSTVDFELHNAEETELVYKILKFAGLSIKKDDLSRGGQGLESLQVQQEKQ